MDISVIIPVYNDAQRLGLCLDAVANQSFKGSYEVIVVDNGSKDFSIVKEVCERYQNVVLIQELSPGSYSARNTGCEIAEGKVLAFTDSDCIPSIKWLESALVRFSHNDTPIAVAGDVSVFFKDDNSPTWVELYESEFAFRQKELVAQGHCVTANLLVSKESYDKLNGFNGKALSGGDVDFSSRLVAAGVELVFEPNASVRHPARDSWADYQHKIHRVFGGAYQLAESNDYMKQQFSLKGMLKHLIPPIKGVFSVFSKRSWQDATKISAVLIWYRYYSWWVKLAFILGIKKRLTR